MMPRRRSYATARRLQALVDRLRQTGAAVQQHLQVAEKRAAQILVRFQRFTSS